MVTFPPCKINLGLNVIAKREDGYHNLETCFFPVPWADILEIIPSSETVFTSSGISILGKVEDNLCLKAYYLLKEEFKLPSVKIHLHKIIPIGAGLGGGSSDAAHTVRLLNTIFSLCLSSEQLKKYAAQLGSDCSFFIQDEPLLGSGRGEILNPISISLTGFHLILIKPSIHISTKEAYEGLTPKMSNHKLAEILNQPVLQWKGLLKNDFEESIFSRYPGVLKIKDVLYQKGAVYASMSGSGSAVFGLFDKSVSLKDEFTEMDYWEGILD